MTRARVVFVMLAVMLPSLPASAYYFDVTESQITSDTSDQTDPSISGAVVAWTDFRNQGTDIYMYDIEAGVETRVTDDPGDQYYNDISGNYIVYTDYSVGGGDVFIYDISTGQSRNLTNHPAQQRNPVISGSLVVFEDDRNGDWDLYAIDIDSNQEQVVCDVPGMQRNPEISGTVVVWEDYRNGSDFNIYLRDLAGGGEVQVSSDTATEQFPHVDGDIVVYNSDAGYPANRGDILAYRISTGDTFAITTGDAWERIPVVSGDYIAFERIDPVDGDADIWLYSLSLGEEVLATSNPADQYLQALDGNRLVYTDNRNGNLDIYLSEFVFEGTAPQIAVQPMDYDFGYVMVGDAPSASIVISNLGDRELVVDNIRIEGDGSFSAASALPAPFIIPPTDGGIHSESVTVTFAPTQEGLQQATLVIENSDLLNPAVTVQLFGSGLTGGMPSCVDSDNMVVYGFDGSDIAEDYREDINWSWVPFSASCYEELENGTLDHDSDGEKFYIRNKQSHCDLSYYRWENLLESSPLYMIVWNSFVLDYESDAPDFVIGADDGEKSIVVMGSAQKQEVWFAGTNLGESVDVTVPAVYMLLVDRSARLIEDEDSERFIVRLFRDGEIIIRDKYNNFPESQYVQFQNSITFGCYDSDTAWDYVNYMIATTLDADNDGYGDDDCFAGADCDDSDPAVHPGAAEVCDTIDNNCDGNINEDLTRPCIAYCGTGYQVCQEDGTWSECNAPLPEPEVCNGTDDNCNGFIDEWLISTGSCVSDDLAGECKFGNLSVCQGGHWVCQGSPPAEEMCDGLDNDCDGETDEPPLICEPQPGCRAEVCDGIDNDCDGQVDNGAMPGVGESCYANGVPSPSPNCQGELACVAGDLVCTGYGPIKPDLHCDGVDEDCNGIVDDNCLLSPSDIDGYIFGSDWNPSDCIFLSEAAELSSCFTCTEPLPPFPGTSTCTDNPTGCIGGFYDEQGGLLGPHPVPEEYPHGTFLLAYGFGSGEEAAMIYQVTITAQEQWLAQFPLAIDFIAYESDEFLALENLRQGALAGQARVIRRVVELPVPESPAMTFYFVPPIETRHLALVIHGLRYYQDPDPGDGDDSGCFTALAEVTFNGGSLPEYSAYFDSDGDGLPDDYERSLGMDPDATSICDLVILVGQAGIENQGIENSLTRKAQNACRQQSRGNLVAAGNMLRAFLDEVEAQSGVHIQELVAGRLLDYVRVCLGLLVGGERGGGNPVPERRRLPPSGLR